MGTLLMQGPCDAAAQLRVFFNHRTLVKHQIELFTTVHRDRDHIRKQIERMHALISSAGRMWGDNVHYCMHLHLDSLIAASQMATAPDALPPAPSHEELLPNLSAQARPPGGRVGRLGANEV